MTTQVRAKFDPTNVNRRTYTLTNLDGPMTEIPSAEFYTVITEAHQAQLAELEQLGENAVQIGSDLLMIGEDQPFTSGGPDIEMIGFKAVDETATIVTITKNCAASWPQIEERFYTSLKTALGEDIDFQYESNLTRELVTAGTR